MSPARRQVVKTLARQLKTGRSITALSIDTTDIDPREARLAVAIHRTVLQRFATLEYLIDRHLKKPLRTLEPTLQAVLVSGAAQLFFMDKLPAHAVVDESVKIARQFLRAGAGKMANAVLRRLADLPRHVEQHTTYAPAADRLPLMDGALIFESDLLPATSHMDAHLAAATSHSVELVKAWREQHGAAALPLLLHSLVNPPTIVRSPAPPPLDLAEAHERAGFYVWRGTHAALVTFLNAGPGRWVQDPTSFMPVDATSDLAPGCIIDYCAGRGTKSRQLRFTHPAAQIIATDPDAERFADLAQVPGVTAAHMDAMTMHTGRADLLVLDVPCSNTGVLARRPEARYRFHARSLASLTELQRDIVDRALPLLSTTGMLLYATCSIDPAENQQQVRHTMQTHGLKLIREHLTLPAGVETTYHDGGYFALLAC